MNLKINNVAKIKNANIIIDWITVIAGENNTGKSTVGKILFSLFNAISNIDERIVTERKNEINESCRLAIRNSGLLSDRGSALFRNAAFLSRKIAEEIVSASMENKLNRELVYNIVCSELDKRVEIYVDEREDMIGEIVDKIMPRLDLSEHSITLEVLSGYFDRVFNDQINSLIDKGESAKLNLNIKDKNIDLEFNKNECVKFESNIAITHKAIYIDNPFVLDKLSDYGYTNIIEGFLKRLLTNYDNEDVMEGIIEKVLSKEKLEKIYSSLNMVVHGDIVETSRNEYSLADEYCEEPISFKNLSAGLKSFVIIKMLLERNKIGEKDVLILDEPEIHLHPQWQVIYAEIIVLLQKYFDLSIVVTTHSPYFLDAINLYSIKHEIDKGVNYYLSTVEDGRATMEQVTDNIDKIYGKMSTPLDYLDTLRYELNNN